MARLENWTICSQNHIHGQVFDDDRFPDGSRIQTSSIVEINEAEGWAQTKNTRYLLGKKAG